MINEVLDLALIESGKLSLSPEPVSLADVMLECQTMIEPQAQQRGIRVTFPRLEVPHFVEADRTRVKQVLINLLSNAIKYNRMDGTVVVSCALSAPGRVRIWVEDTGEGLSPEDTPSCSSRSIGSGGRRARRRARESAWWCASGWSN